MSKKLPFGKGTRVPAIPDIRTAGIDQVLRALKEWVEVRQGSRGDGLDRAVTFRDLLNTRIVGPGDINGLVEGIPPIPLLPGDNDPAIPPTPTNLAAAGAISTIILTWDFPRGYSRLAYFEVWRSETDALGDAVMIAQVYEPMYADEVGPKASYYYWVRAVSDAGASPFNAVAGTLGQTALDVQEVVDAITGEINNSGLLEQLTIKVDSRGYGTGWGMASTPNDAEPASTFAILADRFFVAPPVEMGAGQIATPLFTVQTVPTTINGVAVPKGVYMTDAFIMNGTITNAKIGNLAVDDAKIANMSVTKLTAGKLSVGAYIESSNYASGDTGFIIHGNGNAEFNNATVRGGVYSTFGVIGGVTIRNNGLTSSNYNGTVSSNGNVSGSGTAGWAILSNGSVVFNSGTFRGALDAATGTFAGSLSAATGTFTGRVHGGYLTTGAFTEYAWPPSGGTGTYLGPSGFLMGNYNDGRYFQVSAEGNVFAPGMSIVNGTLTINQANVIDTLNLQGNAVTIPTGNQSTAEVALSPTSWTELLSVVHNGQGYPTFIMFTVDATAMQTFEYEGEFWNTPLTVETRMTFNDSELAVSGGTTLTYRASSGGNGTYRFYARISLVGWRSGGTTSGSARRRTAFIMAVKR